MRWLFKLLVLTMLMGSVIFPVYAFASSNSGAQKAGEGATTISGWQVSNIHYELANDPTLVEGVTLDLDAPADIVKVSLDSKAGGFASCTNVSEYHWQCNFPVGIRISNLNELCVIALNN